MKNFKILFSLLLITSFSFAQTIDTWTQKDSLPGIGRAAAFAFSIGNKGYAGGGINFSVGSFKDFYEYDPATDSWTQKANYGGGKRSAAVTFTIGGKGYVLTGADSAGKKNDIWEYDPAADTWTEKTPLPDTARNYAVAFSIGGKGYLGTGYTSVGFVSLNDFWEFDPVANSWTQKANVPGPQRSSAIGFAINGKGYIGIGDTCDGSNCYALNDFYEYDPLADSWTPKANVGTSLRNDAVAFVVNGKGYVCTGAVNFANTIDLLQYDPVFDSWTTKASIPGAAKENAMAFAVGNHGYVGTGYDPLFNTTHDFYEYLADTVSADTTTDTTFVKNIFNDAKVIISPNPVIDEATISVTLERNNTEALLELFSTDGRKISPSIIAKEKTSKSLIFRFNKNNMSSGIYFYRIMNKENCIASGRFAVL